jgi:acyl-CoA synthetase (AMP-forming)/AMP-acid ligase II
MRDFSGGFMSLIDFFDRGADIFAANICFEHADGAHRYTYAETADLTRRIANGMRAAGVEASDSFAVYSPNHALAFTALLGGLRIGAKWVNLNARSTADEALHAMQRNDCAFLFYHSTFEHLLPRIFAETSALKGAVRIDAGEAPGLVSWARAFSTDVADLVMSEEDIAGYFSTGGTTGTPKTAKLSNRAFSAMASGFLAVMHFDGSPSQLLVAPMTHAAGVMTFPLFSLGVRTVFVAEAKPKVILEALAAHKINVIFLPPTLIYMLLAEPNVRVGDYSALKYFVYAAAPMSPAKLAEAMEVFGPVMMQTYGQVEAPMILTCLTPAEHAEALADPDKRGRLASCGRPTHVARVAIMDGDGALLGPGAPGEIVCRGPLVMSGYRNAPTETEAASQFGWHHTGDVGYRDEDGYLYIVDRIKDMIISGGFNIFPSEIETYLLSLPEVQDCAVVGVPDEKWGEAVKAVLELKLGATLDPDAVIALCKAKLGGVKTPKSVEIWETLPRSAVGKVLKRAVRDVFWKGAPRAI